MNKEIKEHIDNEEPDYFPDEMVVKFIGMKCINCRKWNKDQCLKFKGNIFIVYATKCLYGYYGEFNKMLSDLIKERNK